MPLKSGIHTLYARETSKCHVINLSLINPIVEHFLALNTSLCSFPRRPLSVCLCAHFPRKFLQISTTVHVLQHPREVCYIYLLKAYQYA